jgi:hypothetical protein
MDFSSDWLSTSIRSEPTVFDLHVWFTSDNLILIISGKRWRPNRRFVELTEDEENILKKIGKRMVAIRSRYFHLVFERIFSDVLFLRSPWYKVKILLQQKTQKVWRPNVYASDYINALLRTALTKYIEWRPTENILSLFSEHILKISCDLNIIVFFSFT